MKLTHIRLLVKDFQTSLKFYRDTLGLKPRFGGTDSDYEEFEAGNAILAIFSKSAMAAVVGGAGAQASGGSQDAFTMCVSVENVDSVATELQGKGIKLITEPTDRKEWGIRTAHFRDPDGNLVEINHLLKDQ